MQLKQTTSITNQTTLLPALFPRPIHDEDEHTENESWDCF